MKLIWKLLRQHISVPQFIGFFFANLFGMFIVLLGYQFYCDVLPVFTAEDSFMKSDYHIISKKISAASTISGRTNTFSLSEIDELSSQPFIEKVGKFTTPEYKVNAQMGINGVNVLNSEIPIESVPDEFIDIPLKDWKYTEGDNTVPIILPRTYITMYNFGFAQSHSLPKISEGLMGMIDFRLFVQGHGFHGQFEGKVIGFSSRLNSILVPQAFMDWSNDRFAPGEQSEPMRLMMEVGNPADENIAEYFDSKGYEVEDSQLNAEKTTYFLKMIVTMVMAVGLVISILSFYILMLSIYLLVQKNTEKLQNLLLIGYTHVRVALPYQLLTIGLNVLVLLIALTCLFFVRDYYMGVIETLFPQIAGTSMVPAVVVGTLLFVVVSVLNIWIIRRKVSGIVRKK